MQEISKRKIKFTDAVKSHLGLGRRLNKERCKHCNSTKVDFRISTRDLRCKDCHGITPIKPRAI